MTDLGDSIDDFPLLLDVAALSSVVMRFHSDPPIHSLHDQFSQVEVFVDIYDQQLQRVSSSVEETDSSLREVLQPVEQVSETSLIYGILSTHSGSVSFVPMALFLPKGSNTILQSWISFFIGAVTG